MRHFNFGRMGGFFVDIAGQDGFGINNFVSEWTRSTFKAQTLQFFDQHVEAFRNFRTDNFGVFLMIDS